MRIPSIPELIHPELSYEVMGILFEVHNRLGGTFEEKYYQRAVTQLLMKHKLKFDKELKADISFEGDKIGKYFLDFLVEDKIILELKAIPKLLPIHFRQVRSYLKVKNLHLGILANFRGEALVYKRVLNGAYSH
ncbi:MAG: GxxExxY protein [Candidatus Levybacteria bacterium]|nr:GxxExxY protein [Candidatus Levybacteria bacterium]